jgi:uncharacterized Zn finger protein
VDCDHCGSDRVSVDVGTVRPHGERFVFRCGACGSVWISTDPSGLERILLAVALADGEGSSS